MTEIQINAVAPAFTFLDYQGKRFSLADKKNKENVLLVFNRNFL